MLKKYRLRLIIIFLVTWNYSSYSQLWLQVGLDIDGQEAWDNSGYDVSINDEGNIIAVAEPGNSDGGASAGQVRVFEDIAGNWVQKGSDIEGGFHGHIGVAVDIDSSGNRLAILSMGELSVFTLSGYAIIMEFDGNDWIQIGDSIYAETPGEAAGNKPLELSNDGNIVAIGYEFNDGGGIHAGSVRVFSFNGSTWNQMGSDLNGTGADDLFGYSLNLNPAGNRIAIGAYESDEAGINAGQVKVYDFNGTDWVQLGSTVNGVLAYDYFGVDVGLSSDGNTFIASGTFSSTDGSNAGHVRVFQFDGVDWIQKGNTINGEYTGDFFGISVNTNEDGSVVYVGAYGNLVYRGNLAMFRYCSGNWIEEGWDLKGEGPDDYFAHSHDITPDGKRIIVGARQNDGNADNAGHSRVFRRQTITVSGNVLTSENYNATYQWIDCATNTPIAGATGLDYAPEDNGEYAVVNTTIDGCVDTSDCITISTLAFPGVSPSDTPYAFPNPFASSFQAVNPTAYELEFTLFDASGKLIYNSTLQPGETTSLEANFSKGLYRVEFKNPDTGFILSTKIVHQ